MVNMKKENVAELIGITRQHLDLALQGKRNFSFAVAQKAVALIGGEVTTWLDSKQSDTRRMLWSAFMFNQGARRCRPRKGDGEK